MLCTKRTVSAACTLFAGRAATCGGEKGRKRKKEEAELEKGWKEQKLEGMNRKKREERREGEKEMWRK